MPSRRQIREAAIQFLYCADLEGGAHPSELRDAFWSFVTESDRRELILATFRTVQHLSAGRQERLAEFQQRFPDADARLAGYLEAEQLKIELRRIAELESAWGTLYDQLTRIPKDSEHAAEELDQGLKNFFRTDRDLALTRVRFLQGIDDFPGLRNALEPVAASVRRLQRISDRVRMVEKPEEFPDNADIAKLRKSKEEITKLRNDSNLLVDAILARKDAIDEKIASVVDNYSPERIDPVDRAVLRLGTYELIFVDKTPAKVAINEGIELAKRFGSNDSGRFVNGVLDRIAKDKAPS